MPRAEIDAWTLLCEPCGYVVEGLDPASACPECGKPIAESLPERRIGTPYQHRPTLRNLAKTWWMTVRHPIRTLDVMRFNRPFGEFATIGCASLIGALSIPLLLMIFFLDTSHYNTASAYAAIAVPVITAIYMVVLASYVIGSVILVLTIVEIFGLSRFMTRRSKRDMWAIANAVCAHGCVGWMISALCFTFGLFCFFASALFYHGDRQPLIAVLTGVGVLAGFLFFEVFAYLGLRRLKYANRPRPPSGDST